MLKKAKTNKGKPAKINKPTPKSRQAGEKVELLATHEESQIEQRLTIKRKDLKIAIRTLIEADFTPIYEILPEITDNGYKLKKLY